MLDIDDLIDYDDNIIENKKPVDEEENHSIEGVVLVDHDYFDYNPKDLFKINGHYYVTQEVFYEHIMYKTRKK